MWSDGIKQKVPRLRRAIREANHYGSARDDRALIYMSRLKGVPHPVFRVAEDAPWYEYSRERDARAHIKQQDQNTDSK